MQQSPTPRLLKYGLFFLFILACVFLLFINSGLASLAGLIWPGSALAAHGALMAVEALGIVWFWRGLFGGRRRLRLSPDAGPEEQRAFARELAARMKSNPRIKAAGIVPEGGRSADGLDAAYLERCLALLNQQADEEIRKNAKRIFLATALVQNGRLDALIVFVALCRLVWRVSGIYNHRPEPGEITSLYWAVITSSFLAFALEELDVGTEITVGFGQALQAMLPAGMANSVPFAGKALHAFTSASLDGASNCYLALRAGIITRNCYVYGMKADERPGRAAVFREAGNMLLEMTGELVGKVAAAVAAGIAETAKNATVSVGEKTARAGKGFVGGIGRVGQGIGSGAGKLAQGTAQGAEKIAAGTVGAVDKLASNVADTAGKLGSGTRRAVGKAASGAARAVQATGSGIARAGSRTVKTAGDLGGKAVAKTGAFLARPFTRLRGKKTPPDDEGGEEQ
jgi:hypothetical protein